MQPLPFALGIRVVPVAIALLLMAFMPYLALFYLVFVFGHAHNALATWYQADAGKWPRRKIALFALLFALLAGFTLFGVLPLALLMVLTGILFILHFAFDEIHLLGSKASRFTVLEVAPFVLLFSALHIDSVFGLHVFEYALPVAVALTILSIVLSLRVRRPLGRTFFFALGWSVLTGVAHVISILHPYLDPNFWLLALVVIHYGIWYGAYWQRLASRPDKRMTFVWRIIFVHAVLILLALAWASTLVPFLFVIYGVPFFYIWTVVHILASVRPLSRRQNT